MNIHPFIFSWKGQFDTVVDTERSLSAIFPFITVVNSDHKRDKPHWVNLGEEAYFGQQFLTAIHLLKEDVLFHIQGDATYVNWNGLVADAQEHFLEYNWGIYAPNVDYSYHDSSKVDLSSLACWHKGLRIVSCTDCTCWFIHKDIIHSLKDRKISLTGNKYGWGIDIILSAISFMLARPVIRDYRHTITHPKGTGYNFLPAASEMNNLFRSLDSEVAEAVRLVQYDRDSLSMFFD